MKKIIAAVMSAILIFCFMSTMVYATDVTYEQPFDTGTLDSERYRIPAILTLNDGSVLAAADMRYGHGSDSPNNIDVVVAKSADGYTGWEYNVINHFDDYADGVTETASASFIDSAIVQSKKTDRIFIVTDAWTSEGGYPTCKKGTGFTTINGEKYLLLTTGSVNDSLDTFKYYVGAFADGFAPVLNLADGSATGYSVDAEYDLYKDGAPVYQQQVGSDKMVQQNVFYDAADFCAYNTCYLWMRYSDDNGATWSSPVMISAQVKNDKESFLGIGPGQGFVTEYNGNERIIFCVYDNSGLVEKVSTIYSDDNGVTWQRGAETSHKIGVGKTSEAQIVSLPDGTLRMYARDDSFFVAYADSTDGGATWSKFQADTNLPSNGNCMVSFINVDKKINGKNVILGSFASNQHERADGVVVVGLVNNDNSVEWITKYHVTSDFFAYSCLTQLADGNIGYLYEDEAAHISYMVLTLADDGTLSEINGNNHQYVDNADVGQKILSFLIEILVKFLTMFNLI